MLFDPITLRSLTIPNRVWMAPMCQYSAVPDGPEAGVPHDWHLSHLAARAAGGAGLILTEATAVSPEGRISPADLGLWNDHQQEAFTRITRFLKRHGTVPGIQLGHAGRKASTDRPWRGGGPVGAAGGGWQPLAPSPIPFAEGHPVPRELTQEEIRHVIDDFAQAARRALRAGFQVVEVHGAHGYLIGEFLSPHSNHRTDAYGGPFENRIRLALEVAEAVRAVWPQELPVFFRVSATDWLTENPEDEREGRAEHQRERGDPAPAPGRELAVQVALERGGLKQLPRRGPVVRVAVHLFSSRRSYRSFVAHSWRSASMGLSLAARFAG
ncbi:hypothetical protein ACFQ08_20535 [Streptosporangium algeriense]|uniref:NADH:flavin oxidoreductase/NADH oxidase N-terminal domain-containing protein n=1 Tax=Streptosporangium algeriense TaxID=1682748 RepID=A0ABW3DW32_9ACTN